MFLNQLQALDFRENIFPFYFEENEVLLMQHLGFVINKFKLTLIA